MNLNRDKMNPSTYADQQALGMCLLRFAVRVARHQLEAGGLFALEHPASADSWSTHGSYFGLVRQNRAIFAIVSAQQLEPESRCDLRRRTPSANPALGSTGSLGDTRHIRVETLQ